MLEPDEESANAKTDEPAGSGAPERVRQPLSCYVLKGCVGSAIIGFVLFLWCVIWVVRGPQSVEHVRAEESPYGVPPGATDVCAMTPAPLWPNHAYEFSIDEATFVAWARRSEWPVEEITAPVTILRYFYFMPSASNRSSGRLQVDHGLAYVWQKKDAGLYVVYDRNTGRAYVWGHTR